MRDPTTQLHAGDTSDPKWLGFHSMRLRKVRGGITSPEGRAVLHQAADKIFVYDQEIRWAKEGLCMMEDAQLMTGFGGQLGNVAFSGKIMADSENQKLEGKDFFKRIVEKVYGVFF